MARTFATQQPAVLLQLFQHIAVTHLGAHEFDALRLECQLHGQVGHERADSARHRLPCCAARLHHHIEQLIAVVQAAVAVDHLQAVSIAVEG